MIKNAHWIGIEREGHERASRGPRMTFLCKICGQSRQIVGRRRVAGKWQCGICLAKNQESG